MTDWEEVAAFTLALPDTELSTSYAQPAVKVRSPHDEKAVLIDTDPATFWQTPHYANWPACWCATPLPTLMASGSGW